MLTIGNLTLKSDAVAAPLAGLSDIGFRSIASSYGAGLVYTEMVSVKGLLYGNAETAVLLSTSPDEGATAVQLFGREPALFAQVMHSPLLDKFDVIDINMGCPVPKVVKNGEGSALMKEPSLAAEIVAAVKENAKGRPVTVKIRSGWESVTAPDFAKALEKGGADAVAVHGRLRTQFYSGYADYGVIKAVKEAVSIPVIGNGDVKSAADYLKLKNESGCDGVMIGRGAVGNQKIFAEITGEPYSYDPVKDICRHYATLRTIYLDKVCVNLMKAHVMYYVKGVKGAAEIRRDAAFMQSYEDVVATAERIKRGVLC